MGEQVLAGHHLIEEDAHVVEVAPSVEGLPARLFGAQVGELTAHHARPGVLPARALQLGDAEVRHFDRAIEGDEHVRGSDVPMHELRGALAVAQRVCVRQSFAHEGQELRCVVGWDGAAAAGARRHGRRPLDERAEIDAPHELHHQVPSAALLAEVVHVHDVGVIHPRHDPRLGAEEFGERRVRREVREHALDDQLAGEPLRPFLLCEEDLCHPALREFSQENVGT